MTLEELNKEIQSPSFYRCSWTQCTSRGAVSRGDVIGGFFVTFRVCYEHSTKFDELKKKVNQL